MMIQPAANDDAAMKKKSLHQKDGANTMFIEVMTHGRSMTHDDESWSERLTHGDESMVRTRRAS